MKVLARARKWVGRTGILLVLSTVIMAQHQAPPDHVDEALFNGLIMDQADRIIVEMDKLTTLATGYQGGGISLEALKKQLSLTRSAYKKLESVVTYYYPEHIKSYINGPPIDHIDPLPIGDAYQKSDYYVVNAEEYKQSAPLDKLESGHYSGNLGGVIPPEGLQALDALIFSDEAAVSKQRIKTLCQKLKSSFDVVREDLNYRKYYHDYEMIESLRLELIRILSLGITGFDTPGSLNALPETSTAIAGIKQLIRPFLDRADQKREHRITSLLTGAQAYLSVHNDFGTFDRLTFIVDFLDPLYDQLLQLQVELGIKSTAEIYHQTPSWNSYSHHLFDPDFLNPYYYGMLQEKDDSPLLRKLGKKLFFDTRLSSSLKMSCASCHKPELAYTDGKAVSIASVQGKTLLRNAPTLLNAVFSDRYFYDLRAFDLADQFTHVIKSPLEFDTDYKEIVSKLSGDTLYTNSFDSIFGSNIITRYHISSALTSYVISLKSYNSPFDKYMRGETKSMDKKVKEGFNLFMGKANCGTCHYAPNFSGLVPPLFVESESEALGVLAEPNGTKVDKDLGRSENGISNEHQHIYEHSFKTTTVRNVQLTAPYFHNGAYKTLDEVLNFYNKGGAAGMGLSQQLPNQTLDPKPLGLTAQEVEAIKAFLNALTDVPKG